LDIVGKRIPQRLGTAEEGAGSVRAPIGGYALRNRARSRADLIGQRTL